MNPAYATVLALLSLFGVGIYQIARGIRSIRRRTESTLFGWLRIGLGALLVAAPFPLLYYLRGGQG